jgi:hypothetical protein
MDEVLLTFGKLALEFCKLTDAPVQQALMESLERRWSKSDQDVFIAAIVLNPFHRLRPFRPERSVVSLGAVHALLSRLWVRFYPTIPLPHNFYSDTRSYLHGQEPYDDLVTLCDGVEKEAAGANPVCKFSLIY